MGASVRLAGVAYVAVSIVFLSCVGSVNKTQKGADEADRPDFTETLCGDRLTDPRDNKTYCTVTIGDRTWMAENLNHQTDDSWCYGDDNSNCVKYGRLYTWDAAVSACPTGWRLPNDTDWDDLMTVVGGTYVSVDDNVGYWENVGKKLKSKSGWRGNGSGTDEYGFSALPGGYRRPNGDFNGVGFYGYYWSATEHYDATYARDRYMDYAIDNVNSVLNYKADALSVRCLR